MSTFGASGRDLSGWAPLLELARTLFDKPGNAGLRAGILYARQMPETSPINGGTIDIVAGTSVSWNANDDDLDHHWEVRRLERLAPSWRSLLPSSIDFEGWSDAECTIELTRGRVIGIACRENGEDTDSTLAVIHDLVDGEWVASVEVSWACDDPASDLLAEEDDVIAEQVEWHGWRLHGTMPTSYRLENGDLVVTLPTEALRNIDRENVACAA